MSLLPCLPHNSSVIVGLSVYIAIASLGPLISPFLSFLVTEYSVSNQQQLYYVHVFSWEKNSFVFPILTFISLAGLFVAE